MNGSFEEAKMIDKVIKTELEYEAALNEIERLIDLDPEPGTREADRLELFTLLVGDYEEKNYTIVPPDPIDAIEFRMEQQSLAPRDLLPYLGSRSKVSEVLNRKRPLTLSMIRSLHSGLGIPASVLLQEQALIKGIEWERFPLKEMLARGWIEAEITGVQQQAERLLRAFFGSVDPAVPLIKAVLYRQSSHVRSGRSMDEYALIAWTARVMHLALETPPGTDFQPGTVDLSFMRELARLSVSDRGPALARDFLGRYGISLVIEPHLPGTYLDGAALMRWENMPVIGLTLRFDRIDNFWFCLMHELAHVALHFSKDVEQFYDDLEVDLEVEAEDDPREREADELAGEALIPQAIWNKSPASRLRSPLAAESLAKELEIHPAIVAGRMRHEFKAYRLLSNLVGYNEVRRLFPDIEWA